MLGKSLITAAAGNAGAATDDNFSDTTLLLQADDVNDGSQNNTFLDSSTNAHTITRNGNVTQGSFSPFSQDEGKWGNYFEDGETNTLSIADNTVLDIYDGDYTVEFWVYITEFSSSLNTIISKGTDASAREWAFTIKSTDTGVYVSANGSANSGFSVTTTNNTHEWIHFAYVRSGSTITVYKNGSSIGSGTYASTSYKGSGKAYIGRFVTYNNINHGHKGYISNLRIVKGSAVYSSAFTPSTTPLTDITNTTLLTCQSNRFVDNSSNAHAITLTGTPKVVPFSPFPQTTAYDASTNGGSGYFGGSDDYLSTASNDILSMGTNDFTVNMWVYPIGGTGVLLDNNWDAATNAWQIYLSSLEVQVYNGNGGGSNIVITGGTLKANSWSYLSVVKSGTTVTIYINGSSTGSGTANVTFGRTTNNYVGVQAAGTSDYTGYISDLVVIKNSAVAPSGIPSSPPSSSGTELCLNFTNASIKDATGKNVLETVGDAQVDTAVAKYGTGSMQFDGTGDYLISPETEQFGFGTGDYTIEGWFYQNVVGTQYLFDMRTASNSTDPLTVFIDSGSSLSLYKGSTFLILQAGTFSTGQWNHFAVTRSSTGTRMFLNGTQVGSTVTDNTDYPATALTIASRYTVGVALNGYIDDFRITKGVARYTANFTPPAAKLPNL